MLDKNEMLDFFDGWNDKPENIGRGERPLALWGDTTTVQENGRGMRNAKPEPVAYAPHPWFDTDKEIRNIINLRLLYLHIPIQ